MNQNEISLPLNTHQIDILKLFAGKLTDEDFSAIKKLIVKYLADKVSDLADEVWEEKGWTNEDMEWILGMHRRTPYIPKN